MAGSVQLNFIILNTFLASFEISFYTPHSKNIFFYCYNQGSLLNLHLIRFHIQGLLAQLKKKYLGIYYFLTHDIHIHISHLFHH
jgi:hypothetical protein